MVTPGVIFDVHNKAVPDVAYMSNERLREIASGKHIEGAPELMIEVMSPGAENRRRDQIVKRQIYARFGVEEYWIADAENRSIEVYRLENNQLVLIATLTEAGELTTPLLPGFACKVAEIFHV